MDYSKQIDKLRHSCAHIMAQAVKELWPEVKVTIGPAIDDGFYYDFERKEPFTDEDLAVIEKKMRQIIEKKPVFKQSFMPKDKAIEFFTKQGETYKVELIQALPDKEVSLFTTGENGFVDLCKGPHVENAGEIKAFKLLSVAGSYWHGDEDNARLQRIYGTCFENKEALDEHLKLLDEAQKRDHRKLGVQLDLFNFYHEEAGAGLVFYHPDGAMLRKIVTDYIQEENLRRDYQIVTTPHILKGNLWQQSGHAGYYRENMYFFEVDKEEFAVKPMNCPGHVLIYKSHTRSYRDMPIKYFELGTVYRREKAGVLHGLLRVRGFTQDDAHIFCRREQIKEQIMQVIDFVFSVMKDFGFSEFNIELSTRPEKFIGKVEDWDEATKALENALIEKKLKYQINEGDGAFYGPKIDIKLRDALKREWQCATIQCDFALPQRFDMAYVNEEGKEDRPIMIHRAILGSVERFIGTLIEHYGGAFPVWLSPKQVLIIPIKEDIADFANKVKEELQSKNIRVIIDSRNESLNKRIREGTMSKVPYILVVGAKEKETQAVSVRKYAKGDLGVMPYTAFIEKIQEEIKNKI